MFLKFEVSNGECRFYSTGKEQSLFPTPDLFAKPVSDSFDPSSCGCSTWRSSYTIVFSSKQDLEGRMYFFANGG
jgi:hypothetical protein